MKKVWLKLCSAVLFTMVVTPLAYAGTANFYNITLQGTVLEWPFARQGILAFTTPNRLVRPMALTRLRS
jgi:hypothetical protein